MADLSFLGKDLCEMLRDLQQDESDADRKYQMLMGKTSDPGWREMITMIMEMERMHGQSLHHMHQRLCPPPPPPSSAEVEQRILQGGAGDWQQVLHRAQELGHKQEIPWEYGRAAEGLEYAMENQLPGDIVMTIRRLPPEEIAKLVSSIAQEGLQPSFVGSWVRQQFEKK